MGLKRGVIVCVFASAAMHTAAVTQFDMPDTTLAAASPPPALVSAGNSFEDMVMGTTATPPPTPIEPREVEETVVEGSEAQATPAPTPSTTPSNAPTQTATATTSIQISPDRITDGAADVAATSLAPTAAQPLAPADATPVATPSAVSETTPTRPSDQVAPMQPETLEALPDVTVNNVTANTVRPPDRPANLGQTPPPPPPTPQRTTQRATPAAPSGNAQQDTTRGAQAPAAAPTAQQTTQGQGQQADQAAIAAARQAVANYPNQVVRRISNVRREGTRARGVAVVSFRIGGSGQLVAVSIARSSGNADLDRIAINHIRRAAPFPAPPSGAQTSFSFEFQGR
ncbi:TonB family protein [Thalassobium sp. R2A62]|jgi:protein TonB|uniref:TonB family protein n=1 Tax=Thalassobium sp. R2A62 TaxID=633131 RepID=UPI0001B1D04C|nr:TonB family protein [Thalassobium sp. R2A62]EET47109.1 TonB family C- domain protein [Thalassobium sp. R2A62]